MQSIAWGIFYGASRENRTPAYCLGSSSSTTKLYSHITHGRIEFLTGTVHLLDFLLRSPLTKILKRSCGLGPRPQPSPAYCLGSSSSTTKLYSRNKL